MKHYQLPQEQATETDHNALPTHRPIAAYYRQSTIKQVRKNKESKREQKEDLPRKLKELEWADDLILPVDNDEAVSGTLDILERVGMTRIIQWIENEQIAAVAAVSESRLFRDEFGDQSALFMRRCTEHKVIVLIPGKTPYIFHHPEDGEYHRQRFTREARAAADYITYHVRPRMNGGRDRKQARGEWAGGSIPLGFMVDHAQDDHFVVFEPVAAVIRAWFALFLHYLGNSGATWNHIRTNGPFLPDFEAEAAKLSERLSDGRPRYRLKAPSGMRGRFPTRVALDGLLSNVVYIGLWHTKSVILRDPDGSPKRNHKAIIDDATFWATWNYLSKVDLDGRPNPNYKSRRVSRPRDVDDPRRKATPRPFAEGLLHSFDSRGNLRPTVTFWNGRTGSYEIVAQSQDGDCVTLWRKAADDIDVVIHAMLADLTIRPEVVKALEARWDTSDLAAKRKAYEGLIQGSREELKSAEMRWRRAKIERLADEAEAEILKIEANIQEYQARLAEIDALQANADKEAAFKKRWFELTEDYNVLGLEDRGLVLRMCVSRIEARVSGLDLTITLYLKGGKTEARTIGLKDRGWTSGELKTLRQLLDAGATSFQIAGLLPNRSWDSIRKKAKDVFGRRLSRRGVGLAANETFADFLERAGLPFEEGYRAVKDNRAALLAFLGHSLEEVRAAFWESPESDDYRGADSVWSKIVESEVRS
jgi:hypothetical protein